MFRTLSRPLLRSFSFDRHVSDITKYYNRIRDDQRFANPDHDYPKCLNKINFHIYRLMIDEYENNIKPRENRQEVLDRIVHQFESKGVSLSFHENEGYFSLIRETDSHIFTMRILNYLDDTTTEASAKENDDEPKSLMEKVKVAKTIQYENKNPDERYFYKVRGRIVSPENLPLYRHMISSEENEAQIINPFSLQTDTKDVIDFMIEITSKKNSSKFLASGYICDL
jgi:hypothetical protein